MQPELWNLPENIPPRYRESLSSILKSSLKAVNSSAAVRNCIQVSGDALFVDEVEVYTKQKTGKIKVIAVGKAALAMMNGLEEVLGNRIHGGIAVTKQNRSNISLDKYEILVGSHPVPDEKSEKAAKAVLEFLQHNNPQDLVFFLISGGGSALISLPEYPLQLAEITAITKQLLASGATIQEMNTVRKHLEQVKGGKLALAAAPAKMVSLIISDVVGNQLDVIASGPTVADLSTYYDACQVLKKYQLWENLQDSVKEFLLAGIMGAKIETAKSDNPVFKSAMVKIIASNSTALNAAFHTAREEGFEVFQVEQPFVGEASETGERLVRLARELSNQTEVAGKPKCVLFGGETTVTLHGSGHGGRNQEVALGAARILSERQNELLIAFATDGEDGPTDAAGACVNTNTWRDAQERHLDIERALREHDSYPLLEQMGLLIKTGSTGTNANDMVLWFSFP